MTPISGKLGQVIQMGNEDKDYNWVKVNRTVQSHWVWMDKPFSRGQAWIDLILLAQHQDSTFADRRGNLIDGKRGYVYRSERFLAERWGWSRKKLANYLLRLEQDNMIEVDKKRASERTTIFIVNYETFQGKGASKGASGEPVGNQSGASGEPVGNINKNVKKDKNVKNVRMGKDIVGPAGPPSNSSHITFDSNSFEMQCVDYLIDSCLETCPHSKVPDTLAGKQKWAVEIDRMKRLDGLSEDEIKRTLHFATHDSFWKTNIRSTRKFREKFEVLYSQSQGKRGAGNNSGLYETAERLNRIEEKIGG